MAGFIVDPDRFLLVGALVDWNAPGRRGGTFLPAMHAVRGRRLVQLRWITHERLGYPTRPFEIWRRPALTAIFEQPLPVNQPGLVFNSLFGWKVFSAPEPQTFVRAFVKVTGAQGSVVAYSGAPFGSMVIGAQSLSGGFHTISFSGAAIACVVLVGDIDLLNWEGVSAKTANEGQWELIERVGLPVDPQAWQGVFGLDAPQGPPASPMPPVAAALSRFARGAAPSGWSSVMAPGRAAPHWTQADPHDFLQMMGEDVLGGLREMITTLPPDQHKSLRRQLTLAAESMGEDATAEVSLLRMLLLAAVTDPVASLLTGFGTAIEEVELPPVTIRDIELLNDPERSDFDFRVTATYDRGLDGVSGPVTFAALAIAPRVGVPPPPPSNLSAAMDGLRAPHAPDSDWRPVIRLSWDRIPPIVPLRSAAYAHARADGASSAAVALVGNRKHDTAPHPIGVMSNPDNVAALPRLSASDDGFTIPGMPAVIPLLYGVAHQDIFGLWSAWRTVSINVAEPPVQKVAILSATLEPVAAAGICPATLTLDFTWDWSTRTPAAIRFIGRLYKQAKRGDAPSPAPTPGGLQKSLAGGGGAPFTISFAPDGSALVDAGGRIDHLSTDGMTFLPGPSAASGTRRYRLTIDGFALDFSQSGHIGLLLQASGTERRAPMRTGTPSLPETIASASDPRPPVILVEHEDVLLASQEDAAGRHHALLTWPAAPNAAGYFIYSATESKLRADWNIGEVPADKSLSERLTILRSGFAAHPDRRFFTRLNDKAITATRYEAVLPRGSRDIHLFMIIGISAGGVESDWPGQADPLLRKRPIAYAAPLRRVPEPPTIEAKRVLLDGLADTFGARLRLATRPGVGVDRIDLHRVRSAKAALELDTMGEPVLTLRPGQPGWTIAAIGAQDGAPGQALGIAEGTDVPPGSWKPVYYRAAAWSEPDPTRGILAGRSMPSAAREVIVPPAGPPDLAEPVPSWPSGGAGPVLITTSTGAPLKPTLLGDHRLRLEVYGHAPGAASELLFSWPALTADNVPGDARLAAIPEVQPAGTGLWCEAVGERTRLRVAVTRPSSDVALSALFRIEDPLGRMTEKLLDVPAEPPPPDFDFGPATVRRVPRKGFIIASTINLPLNPRDRAYRIRALLTPRRTPFGFHFPGRGRPDLLFDLPLANVPILAPNDNPFVQPPPVRRRSGGPAQTDIAIYVGPRGGRLQVTLTGPNGRTASFIREVI